MCQPFQTPPSIEICRIYHYIAVLLPEHCFFACKEITNYMTQNSQKDTISFTLQLPNFWRIKSVRRTPGTIRCTPFVRSSLQSHRPPMCPGIFSPFYKIFEMHFGCISQDTYLLYVCKRNAKSLERPAFLPGTFSIAWFARLLTLPSTWPFLRSGTPLRWGHP